VAAGRRKATHRRHKRALAIAVSVLIVAGASGLGWLLLAPRFGEGTLAAESDGASATPTTSKSAQRKTTGGEVDAARVDKPDPVALEKCRSSARTGVDAVEAADDSVGDWAVHIQAMDDLESGKNTEAETKAIWTVTRERGPGRVTVFENAAAGYAEVRDVCADVDPAAMAADQREAVDACRVLGEETDKALAAARNSVAEWKAHLKAMADRRAGQLDPGVAMHTWMAAYEKAPANIDAFHAAESAFRAAVAGCGTPKPS
jgi:hypothetical protein